MPEGRHVGQPVRLRPWQRKIIKGIYDRPTRRAIASFARKNGKTALAALLLLLHLCGPEHRPNSQLCSAAQSRDQAAILFGLAAKMVRMSPEMSAYVTVRDTRKELHCGELGTLYRALSADADTAHGMSPVFIVHDELGRVKGPRSDLYEALETATAAHDDPLSIIISTQAPTDADLLSVLIDDAATGADQKVRLFLYTAPPDVDPFDKRTIKLANPAFGDFQNAEEVMAMAEGARRMPAREAEYRNLILNQRVEITNPLFSRAVWQACASPPLDDFGDLPVYAGLDLSEARDLTAFVAMAFSADAWQVRPTFWLPHEGLAERARQDRVPYDLWQCSGHLETTPGRSVEYEYVAGRLRVAFDEMNVAAIGFDRWNFRHLRPWLVKAGFTEAELQLFVEFGQGFQSMSPALRVMESAVLQGKLAHGGHPVLTMCAANAVVQRDPAGNRKLNKAKSRGRIDGMVALAMAFGVAPEDPAGHGAGSYLETGDLLVL